MKSGIASDFIITLCFIAIGVLAIEGFVRLIADDGKQYDLEMWKYARDVKQISDDPLAGHEHRPNRQAKLMGVDFRTNSKGLRDREFSYVKPPGKLRILMLGDSLTVGWGVAIEHTFAKRVERMYADHGIDAEVINAGVGNYNTIQEVEYFFTEGHKYHPDIIVLNYFVNDAEPILQYHRPSIFERICFACIFISGRFDTLLRMVAMKQDWANYYLSLYDGGRTKGWLDAKENIRMLAEYCKAKNIRFLIASLPELHDVSHYRFQTITELLQDAAQQYGVGFVDILPYVAQQRSSNLWVTPSDPHPNALAHGLVARGLFEALERYDVRSDRVCGHQGPCPVGAQ